jgi:hypothetical protein
MKIAVPPVFFKMVLLLVFLLEYSLIPAQDNKRAQEVKEKQHQQLQALNQALLSDQQKQAELASIYAENLNRPLERDDTVALYLADLDAVIAISQKQNIPYPIKLRDDCRDSLKNDLRQLTFNGVQSGFHFKKIAATNDAYLQDLFHAYKARFRTGIRYGKTVPEFGRADYLKAIKNIFTTIVTLKVSSLPDNVKVVVYSMQEDKFVANSTGSTEFIQPLESGSYIVELSKPGYKKKLRKVVLGKYPKTININEPLVMQ